MEGPSLLICREELEAFVGKKVLKISGNTKQPKNLLKGMKLLSTDSWGKNLFLIFCKGKKTLTVKIHFLMWGSYRVNEKRPGRKPRLQLNFRNGILYFYACSIKFDADDYYRNLDRQVDLMSAAWNAEHVVQLMKKKKNAQLCDLFLDQSVFAGSGNIIKNEVLFNIRRNPLEKLSKISEKDWLKIAEAERDYCWDFYKWKKKFELKKHWQIYRQSQCPVCGAKVKRQETGRFKRRSFFCANCQPLSARKKKLQVHAVLPIPASRLGPPEVRIDH
jgi:endonuclease VIII